MTLPACIRTFSPHPNTLHTHSRPASHRTLILTSILLFFLKKNIPVFVSVKTLIVKSAAVFPDRVMVHRFEVTGVDVERSIQRSAQIHFTRATRHSLDTRLVQNESVDNFVKHTHTHTRALTCPHFQLCMERSIADTHSSNGAIQNAVSMATAALVTVAHAPS